MFGGLEIKGGTPSKDADDDPSPDPEPSVSVPPGPAAGISSFGFMNVGAPEPPAAPPSPAKAAVSSFSFLNPAAPESAPAPVAPPSPAAATSGFSFMMQDPAPIPTTTTTDHPLDEPAAAAPAVPSSSGFDFMNSMATPPPADPAPPAPVVEETIIPTIAEDSQAPPAVPAKSGFTFFTDTPPIIQRDGSSSAFQPDVPTAIHTRANSISSASSALSAPSLPPTQPQNQMPGVIAGAGVTFGTSSAKPRIKKKKIRSAKIGMGISQTDAPTVAAAPAAAPVTPTPAASSSEADSKSARDAALEATNRAEAFMQAKAMEATKLSTETPAPTQSPKAYQVEGPEVLGLQPTASTDEMVAAAQEAAEKAKILQHQQQHHHKGKGKGSGFMGTFFKGFRASPNSTSSISSGPMGNSSKHSVSSQSVGSNSSMDRLAKEQQMMNQAMAERQLKLQQQPKQPTNSYSEDEDDDVVVVTTSVGGYMPTVAEPTEYAAVPEPTTKPVSGGSSFVPATIPSYSKPKPSLAFQPVVPSYGNVQESIKKPVVATPKLNNTPKQIFDRHQHYFSDSVNRAMKKVDDARSLKKRLLEERFVGTAKERFAAREIEQIEELQQAAIDEEDYEQADELGQKLDAHKREKSEVANMLSFNKMALEKLESESTSLGELVVSCFEDLALRLDGLKKTEAASEKKDDAETLTQYASISKQLSAEHERLQQDLKHLERDEQLVGEERKELENSIKDQTGEIEAQKEEASSKLTDVENEIEELRIALQMKQKEAADLRTKMFGFEDSISKVRVKFSRQLTRVDKKEISLKESRREWDIENVQHKRQKDAHDLQVKSHSETLLAHEELMTALESELRLSKEFSQFIPSQLGFMEDESDAEEKYDDDKGSLAQLKANVVKCEGAVDVAKKELKMASLTIQNLQNERDGLVVRIPELEVQKKAAAAGRNFKTAGKFSKEIKDANARIKECEDELNDEAKPKKASAEEKLRQLDSDLLEVTKIADAKEKLSGEKRMATLAKKISQLVKEKAEKCGESKPEGNSVKCVGARVLEGQIMTLKTEGYEIGSKYGGWDELLESIGLDDEDSNVMEGLKGNKFGTTTKNAVQKDKKENSGCGLTSEERLVKAKELLEKCSELEAQVEEAAEKEDFEAAGELQEALDKVNIEIEELNITDEECELLAGIETLETVSPEEQPEEKCELANEERLVKGKELMAKRNKLEEEVQDAVEREDFDAAEEFQTELDDITAQISELNITYEEKEWLSKDQAPPYDDPPAEEESPAATEETPTEDEAPEKEEAPAQEEAPQQKEASAQEEVQDLIPGAEAEEEKKEIDEENVPNLNPEQPDNDGATAPGIEESDNITKKDDGKIAKDGESEAIGVEPSEQDDLAVESNDK